MSDLIQLTIELPSMPKYLLIMLTIWLAVEMLKIFTSALLYIVTKLHRIITSYRGY